MEHFYLEFGPLNFGIIAPPVYSIQIYFACLYAHFYKRQTILLMKFLIFVEDKYFDRLIW
jgi:hypothetical protein